MSQLVLCSLDHRDPVSLRVQILRSQSPWKSLGSMNNPGPSCDCSLVRFLDVVNAEEKKRLRGPRRENCEVKIGIVPRVLLVDVFFSGF